jgi:hypothetical protein
MSQVSLNKINNLLREDSFESNILESFNIYGLLQALAEVNETAKKQIEQSQFTADQWKAYKFIQYHT